MNKGVTKKVLIRFRNQYLANYSMEKISLKDALIYAASVVGTTIVFMSVIQFLNWLANLPNTYNWIAQ